MVTRGKAEPAPLQTPPAKSALLEWHFCLNKTGWESLTSMWVTWAEWWPGEVSTEWASKCDSAHPKIDI